MSNGVNSVSMAWTMSGWERTLRPNCLQPMQPGTSWNRANTGLPERRLAASGDFRSRPQAILPVSSCWASWAEVSREQEMLATARNAAEQQRRMGFIKAKVDQGWPECRVRMATW